MGGGKRVVTHVPAIVIGYYTNWHQYCFQLDLNKIYYSDLREEMVILEKMEKKQYIADFFILEPVHIYDIAPKLVSWLLRVHIPLYLCIPINYFPYRLCSTSKPRPACQLGF